MSTELKPIEKITKKELASIFREHPGDPLAQIGAMNALIVFKLNELIDRITILENNRK